MVEVRKMKKLPIKRYCTALNRIRKSKGFGIHSPFAFRFVLKVLKERLPYYAYTEIDYKRADVIEMLTTEAHKKKHGVLSAKDAKMIFRVVNFFNPKKIMQIGTNYGISSASALLPSSHSELWICGIPEAQHDIFTKQTEEFTKRINKYNTIKQCSEEYFKAEEKPFLIINSATKEELTFLLENTDQLTTRNCVIIINRISRQVESDTLWKAVKSQLTHGMTFSNGKFGVIVANPKLPRKDYSLWF